MNRCKAHAASVLMLVAMVGREPEAIKARDSNSLACCDRADVECSDDVTPTPSLVDTGAPALPIDDGCQGHIR